MTNFFNCSVYLCVFPHPQADIDVFPELWFKETEEEVEERRNQDRFYLELRGCLSSNGKKKENTYHLLLHLLFDLGCIVLASES